MNKDKSKEVKECEEQYQKDIDLCEKELQAQKIIIYAAVAALAAKTIEGGQQFLQEELLRLEVLEG